MVKCVSTAAEDCARGQLEAKRDWDRACGYIEWRTCGLWYSSSALGHRWWLARQFGLTTMRSARPAASHDPN